MGAVCGTTEVSNRILSNITILVRSTQIVLLQGRINPSIGMDICMPVRPEKLAAHGLDNDYSSMYAYAYVCMYYGMHGLHGNRDNPLLGQGRKKRMLYH